MQNGLTDDKPINPWEYFDQRVRSASMARRILPYRPVTVAEKPDLLSHLLRQEAGTHYS